MTTAERTALEHEYDDMLTALHAGIEDRFDTERMAEIKETLRAERSAR